MNKAQLAELAELADGVAGDLGTLRHEGWKTEIPERTRPSLVYLAHGIARLSLSLSYRDDRLHVYGLGPDGHFLDKGQRRSQGIWSISANPARGSLAIAKDINRRIISAGYVDDLLAAVERKRERDERQAHSAAMMAEAGALFGITPHEDGKVYLGEFVRGTGHVSDYRVEGEDLLSIELSGIPRDVAMKMLKVLAQAASSQARCCYKFGPAHDTRLSMTGCLRQRQVPGRRMTYDEAKALYDLYRRARGAGDWRTWLGDAAGSIHPAWA
jgi:hypothetical protein